MTRRLILGLRTLKKCRISDFQALRRVVRICQWVGIIPLASTSGALRAGKRRRNRAAREDYCTEACFGGMRDVIR
jgi:hypothetical protein